MCVRNEKIFGQGERRASPLKPCRISTAHQSQHGSVNILSCVRALKIPRGNSASMFSILLTYPALGILTKRSVCCGATRGTRRISSPSGSMGKGANKMAVTEGALGSGEGTRCRQGDSSVPPQENTTRADHAYERTSPISNTGNKNYV